MSLDTLLRLATSIATGTVVGVTVGLLVRMTRDGQPPSEGALASDTLDSPADGTRP